MLGAALLIVAGAAWSAGPAWGAAGDDPGSAGLACPAAPRPTPGGGDEAVSDVPAAQEAPLSRSTNFGAERDARTMRTTITLSSPLAPGVRYLNVAVGEFERGADSVLDDRHVVAWAEVDPEGRRTSVILVTCVDPVVAGADGTEVVSADAGRYTGSVVIDDPRVAGGGVSYVVSLRFVPAWAVILVVGLGWLVGGVGGIWLASEISFTTIRKNAVRAIFAFALTVSAAGAALLSRYFADPAWAGTPGEFWGLFVVTVAASYTAANFMGSLPFPSKGGDRRQGDGTPATTPTDATAGHEATKPAGERSPAVSPT